MATRSQSHLSQVTEGEAIPVSSVSISSCQVCSEVSQEENKTCSNSLCFIIPRVTSNYQMLLEHTTIQLQPQAQLEIKAASSRWKSGGFAVCLSLFSIAS